MILDIDSHNSFEVGPFWITLREDYRTSRLMFIYWIGDFERYHEPFEGKTLEDARKQITERCRVIFTEWIEDAKNPS